MERLETGYEFREPEGETRTSNSEQRNQTSPARAVDGTRPEPEMLDNPATEAAGVGKEQKQDLILSPSAVLAENQRAVVALDRKCQLLTEFSEAVAPRESAPIIRPIRKRYFILFMFFILQIVKSFQWICLASITNAVAKFYQVNNLAVNWTTILFMVTFLVLGLPVSWIMNSIGLRRSVLIGAFGVSLGVFIKCFSCNRDGFAVLMWGHLIVGLCEPFFFSSCSQLASVWFPDNQVALATAISLIGEQIGLALGFIIPPLAIGNDLNDFVAVQRGLLGLFTVVALISIVNTISILLFFDEEPHLAPGVARYKQKQDETTRRQSMQVELEKKRRRRSSTISRRLGQSVGEQVKLSAKIMRDKHFLLLFVGFGICEGTCYSIHTLLNQMIVQPASMIELPPLTPTVGLTSEQTNATTAELIEAAPMWAGEDATLVVGNAGLIMVMSGLLGSACCGLLLDKYHKHKQTVALVYLLNLVSMLALTGCLLVESSLAFYLATIPLGFAQLGYATCAFDFSVELTYPRPELVASTLLNISAQVCGIPISLVGSMIVDNFGSLALGGFFSLLLLVGSVIACLQGGELRRQNAVKDRESPAMILSSTHEQEPRAWQQQ